MENIIIDVLRCVLTARVDDLSRLFNQALIQALPHRRRAGTFEIVTRVTLRTVRNARSENAPLRCTERAFSVNSLA